MTRARMAVALGSGLIAMLALAALSRAAWRPPAADGGLIRVTLSARPERIERCTRVSEEELARRLAHMRQAVICEGASATYRLRVWRGESLLDDRTLVGGGFRRDRPIHLLRDYPVPAGESDFRVMLERIETVPEDRAAQAAPESDRPTADRQVREAEERQRRRLEALPAMVDLQRRLVISPRQVVLVTWDPLARTLRAGRD